MILSQRHLCVDTTVQHCSPHSPSCSFHKSVSAVSFPRRCIATLPSLPLTHFAHSENPPTLGDQGMGKIRDRKRQCDSLFPQLFSASIRPRTSCSFLQTIRAARTEVSFLQFRQRLGRQQEKHLFDARKNRVEGDTETHTFPTAPFSLVAQASRRFRSSPLFSPRLRFRPSEEEEEEEEVTAKNPMNLVSRPRLLPPPPRPLLHRRLLVLHPSPFLFGLLPPRTLVNLAFLRILFPPFSSLPRED